MSRPNQVSLPTAQRLLAGNNGNESPTKYPNGFEMDWKYPAKMMPLILGGAAGLVTPTQASLNGKFIIFSYLVHHVTYSASYTG